LPSIKKQLIFLNQSHLYFLLISQEQDQPNNVYGGIGSGQLMLFQAMINLVRSRNQCNNLFVSDNCFGLPHKKSFENSRNKPILKIIALLHRTNPVSEATLSTYQSFIGSGNSINELQKK